MLNTLMGFIKFILIFGVVGIFLLHHGILRMFNTNSPRLLQYMLDSMSFFAHGALKILNVKVSLNVPISIPRGYLIVANHLSYLDVLVLSAYYPSFFITSVEIRDTIFLGQVVKLANCFFVERRKELRGVETAVNEMKQIKQKLDAGFSVFLFPEGTSTNGQSVLPFKATFFQTAIECEKPILPLCLKYEFIGDRAFSPENADCVCWYDDMTFVAHLFGLCKQRSVQASIYEFEEIIPYDFNDRYELGKHAHKLISEVYHGAQNKSPE